MLVLSQKEHADPPFCSPGTSMLLPLLNFGVGQTGVTIRFLRLSLFSRQTQIDLAYRHHLVFRGVEYEIWGIGGVVTGPPTIGVWHWSNARGTQANGGVSIYGFSTDLSWLGGLSITLWAQVD